GIKGALPIGFLTRVEEITNERIVDHFDLIAGTSTGGIIALGLGLGIPAADVLSFYAEYGPTIFGSPRRSGENAGIVRRIADKAKDSCGRVWRSARRLVKPKYSDAVIHRALSGVLRDRLLGDSLTRLLIPAYDADRRTVYIFKTSHHERLEVDWKRRAADVALSTAAAPTYFPAHELPSGSRLIDGGIWANNPTGMAVVEAVGVLGWDRTDLRVLSLGCTDEVFIPKPDGGIGHFAPTAIDLLLQGQSFASWGTAKILAGESNVHRINPSVPHGLFHLDDARNVMRLAGMGAECAREALPMLRREFLIKRKEPFVPFHGSPPLT
ncbi:MAG: patatin-like phospholipase family protein, partial [Candidatus Kerfeldbacteria bacterium]|nr:patatin-like phospholipase family protein [Candidatus Kerfeldbacteria bacterium]